MTPECIVNRSGHSRSQEYLASTGVFGAANVVMVGVARLRYRPHTALTAAWSGDLQDKAEGYIEQYDQVTEREQKLSMVAANWSSAG